MFLFLLIALTIFVALYGYVGLRILIPKRISTPWKVFFWVLLLILSLMPFAPLVMRRSGIESLLSEVIAWIGFTGLGFFSLAFFFTLLVDTGRFFRVLISKGVGLWHRFSHSSEDTGSPNSTERRDFLKISMNVGILAASGIFSSYGFVQAHCRTHVKTVFIPFTNIKEDLKSLRIVQISDIHVGLTIKGDFVRSIVTQVNDLEPDLVVLTGDLVDGSVRRLRDDVASLADIRSRYGNFFVTGNHEYYSGVDPWLEELGRLGFTTLLNEHRLIHHSDSRILLGGVTDYAASRIMPSHTSDPQTSLRGAPESDIKILLAHQPLSIYQAASAGYDLQLSGHTHGGQYFPWSGLVALRQPFLSGLYRHDNAWVYVNDGTGYWGPPLRLGTRSEITLIKLIS